MSYSNYVQKIYRNTPTERQEEIRLIIQNEVQGYIVGALAKGLGDAGIVFADMSAARHCYGLPRYNLSNAIRFKIKETVNDVIFKKIMKATKEALQGTLKVDVMMKLLKPTKKRDIFANFYVPKWEAVMKIEGVLYKIVLDTHPVVEEQECRYLDELSIGKVNVKLQAESINAIAIENIALHFDEYSVNGTTLFDQAWLDSMDSHIDLEVFEQVMWDRAATDPERSLMNMQNLLQSSTTRRQLKEIQVIGKPDFMEAPTFNMAADKIQKSTVSMLSELTPHFGEQYQQKIASEGAKTEYGMKVTAKGVDVTGAGRKAAEAINRK